MVNLFQEKQLEARSQLTSRGVTPTRFSPESYRRVEELLTDLLVEISRLRMQMANEASSEAVVTVHGQAEPILFVREVTDGECVLTEYARMGWLPSLDAQIRKALFEPWAKFKQEERRRCSTSR